MTQTSHHSDGELKSAVIDELGWTPSVNSTHIGVAVNDGAVTLCGEASSYPEKYLATKAALRVRGVIAVADEITVRSSYTAGNDTDIAREAGEAIERAVDLPVAAVTATVHQGTVTLSGEVAWQYQREAASRAVRYLRGVTNVLNVVTIRPTASPANIDTSITAALVRGAQLAGRYTDVTSDGDGVVTLEGTVRSFSERQAAAHAAWSAPGVTDVINNVRVGS